MWREEAVRILQEVVRALLDGVGAAISTDENVIYVAVMDGTAVSCEVTIVGGGGL